MTSGTMDPELFRIKWNLFVCFFFALELLLGKRRKVSRNSRTTYETTLLSANLPSTTILAKDQVLQNHTKDTLRNTMVASVSQEGAKCEMIVTPFAGQLEEIDKALFEYRYSKQTQQHQYANNNKFGAHVGQRSQQRHNNQLHQHQHQHQHQHGQGQHLSRQFMNQQSYQLPYVQKHQHVMMASPSPSPVTHQQQQYGNLNQQMMVHQHMHQQVVPQQVHQISMAQPQQQPVYGMGAHSVVAQSPDSFLEGVGGSLYSTTSNNNKLDGFSLNLSSSISSGAGSTSSYSSAEYEMQNKISNVGYPSTILESSTESNSNNSFKVSQDGTARPNEFNVVNEGNVFENFNTVTNNSNRGWLNIWGSDMSVWG
ncbi:CYFA0S11e01860g1_1 [Cyberlindnera fabianii]|uniref:CYFA0S11e01860g1_1 n=1 Tax=Cyberlindnera fabianii TaxID=36022 RepID=A0A061B6C0_CYBFA|nr:CYFA0S11e01860g1_1 [Cyberlindnera fabianii]